MGANVTYALVVVDMQRWFFRYRERSEKLTWLVPNIAQLVKDFGDAGRPVVRVRTAFSTDRRTWSASMRHLDSAVLIEGTADVEELPGIGLPVNTPTVVKTRHSAFIRTDFEAQMNAMEIDGLVLCGVFVDGCVGLTAIDASERDFNVIVARDAVASVNDSQGAAMLRFLAEEFPIRILATRDLPHGISAR